MKVSRNLHSILIGISFIMTTNHPNRAASRRKGDFSEFIDTLLQRSEESPEKFLQINAIATETKVEKRRLYDLMNVLVACGVCVKTDTHTYRWQGLRSFPNALKQIMKDTESKALQQGIDTLFLLPDSPSIGTISSCFISILLYLRLSRFNIRDAAIIMSPDEEKSKPVLRRLYLVAYLLEHIGLLRHTQKNGEYQITIDLNMITAEVMTELIREHEFPPDSIEYQLSRIDANFVKNLQEQRREEFLHVMHMKTMARDDGYTPSLNYMSTFKSIDI